MFRNKDKIFKHSDVTTRAFIVNSLNSFIHNHEISQIPKDINWYKFNDIIFFQKLQPIFFALLYNADIPSFVSDDLRKSAFTAWKENNIAVRDTCWLFQTFEEINVPAVVLRGLSISRLYYPDPSMRPMTDVDILIPPKHAYFVHKHLKYNGILPSKDYFSREKLIYCIGDTLFEIHWSFITPKRYRHIREFEYWLDYRQKITFQNGFFYALPPENEFIGQTVHAFTHHNFQRMLHLLDLSFISKQENLDWNYITHWFNRNKLSKLYVFTLSYLDYLSFNEAPLNITNDKWKLFFDAYLTPSLGKDSFVFTLKRSIFQLVAAETFVTKIKQLLRLFSLRKAKYFFFLLYNRSFDIYVGRANKSTSAKRLSNIHFNK